MLTPANDSSPEPILVNEPIPLIGASKDSNRPSSTSITPPLPPKVNESDGSIAVETEKDRVPLSRANAVLDPSASASSIRSIPSTTDTGPEKVLTPLSVSLPLPAFVNPPVPDITPLNVVSAPDAPAVSWFAPKLIDPFPAIDPKASSAPTT